MIFQPHFEGVSYPLTHAGIIFLGGFFDKGIKGGSHLKIGRPFEVDVDGPTTVDGRGQGFGENVYPQLTINVVYDTEASRPGRELMLTDERPQRYGHPCLFTTAQGS